MLETYRAHVAERAAFGIPPLPLTAQQTAGLVGLLKNPPAGEEAFLVDLITNRVPAGVDDAAEGQGRVPGEGRQGRRDMPADLQGPGDRTARHHARRLQHQAADRPAGLRRMRRRGGASPEEHAVDVRLFPRREGAGRTDNPATPTPRPSCNPGPTPSGSPRAPRCRKALTVTVFKVTGETNTDDLSPAPDAWSRPDIPLHALAMLKNARPGIEPDEPGKAARSSCCKRLRAKGHLGRLCRRRRRHRLLAQVGHQLRAVVHRRGHSLRAEQALRRRLPRQPRSRRSSSTPWKTPAPCRSSSTSPRWTWATWSSCAPIEGKALKNGEVIAEFKVKSDVIFDEVRAGGRIPLIIGRGLTAKAREALGLPPLDAVPPARPARPTPARATRWRRRWSAAPAACPKARACVPAPIASRG